MIPKEVFLSHSSKNSNEAEVVGHQGAEHRADLHGGHRTGRVKGPGVGHLRGLGGKGHVAGGEHRQQVVLEEVLGVGFGAPARDYRVREGYVLCGI